MQGIEYGEDVYIDNISLNLKFLICKIRVRCKF